MPPGRTQLLPSVKIIVPMHYGTFPLLAGTPAQVHEHLARKDVNLCKLGVMEALPLEGRPVKDVLSFL